VPARSLTWLALTRRAQQFLSITYALLNNPEEKKQKER
jgi:hypothetical protein